MLVLFVLLVGTFYVYLAYRKAKQNGHNPIRWAAIASGVFIATQLLVAATIGFFLGLGEMIWGWSENLLYDYQLHREITSLLVSGFTNWLILRHLNKAPDKPFALPPPPPTFN